MGFEPTTPRATIWCSNQLNYTHRDFAKMSFEKMVGVKGFEPSTPWSQTKCANQTALHPEKYFRKIKVAILLQTLCDCQ